MNYNDDTTPEIVGQFFVYNELARPEDEKTFAQVPESFMIFGKHLSFRAKWVYTVLRKFYNKNDKRCFPTRQTVAELAGVSVKTVDKAFDELQTFGWISRRPIASKYQSNGQPMVQTDFTYPKKAEFDYSNIYYRESPTKAEAAEYHKKKKLTAFIAAKENPETTSDTSQIEENSESVFSINNRWFCDGKEISISEYQDMY